MTLSSERTAPERVGTVHLVLPLPPNRANQRVFWRVEHKQKAAYHAEALVRILQQTRASDRRGAYTGAMRVTAKLYVWGLMDDDNAVARLKLPLDSLKRAGLLRDDKRPWCALSGIPEQTIDRKRPRVEIFLEPISP